MSIITVLAKTTDDILQLVKESRYNDDLIMFHVMRLDDTGYHSVYANDIYGDVATVFFRKAKDDNKEVEIL